MEIKKTNQNFGVKLFRNHFLTEVLNDCSNKKIKYEVLHSMRNMETSDIRTRLQMDLFYRNNCPAIVFSRFLPKQGVNITKSINDYEKVAEKEFPFKDIDDVFSYAAKLLIDLGKNNKNNDLYKKIVTDFPIKKRNV